MLLESLLKNIILQNVNSKELAWIEKQKSDFGVSSNLQDFYISFASVARYVTKKEVKLSESEVLQFHSIFNEFNPDGENILSFIRLYFLQFLNDLEEEKYVTVINNIFDSADEGELESLYLMFCLLKFPEKIAFKFAEGVRTNMVSVFEKVALHNPYPVLYLSEESWNQMVTKCFFVDLDIEKIIGLKTRVNPKLKQMATDLVKERQAAGRKINEKISLIL